MPLRQSRSDLLKRGSTACDSDDQVVGVVVGSLYPVTIDIQEDECSEPSQALVPVHQGVPTSSYPNPPQSKQAGMRFQMMNNAHPPGWALFVLWVSWLCDGHQDADHAFS